MEEVTRTPIQVDGATYSDTLAIAIMYSEINNYECSSTWWFNDTEIREIISYLKTASHTIYNQEIKIIGAIDSDASEPCLRIATQRNHLYLDCRIQVQIQFDDELVRESGSNGILWLSENDARYLAKLLEEALEFKKIYPPYVYQPSEPNNITVFQLF
uniref:Uncharacterized protein n=1 Tax=Cyanothece sp. (strain PCC 7425 / ATCC 29141) TaxID=395961 RepID=B8HTQ0_CYAP4